MVSKLGCSFIINHTQIGPRVVSKRKKRLTSAAVINLGAIVIIAAIATHSYMSLKKKHKLKLTT